MRQIVSINDEVISRNSSYDVFGQLMIAQECIGQVRPDLGSTWLQERTNLLVVIGTLFHCGKVNIFDFKERINVEIKWTWLTDVEMELKPLLIDNEVDEVVEATAGLVETPGLIAEGVYKDFNFQWDLIEESSEVGDFPVIDLPSGFAQCFSTTDGGTLFYNEETGRFMMGISHSTNRAYEITSSYAKYWCRIWGYLPLRG